MSFNLYLKNKIATKKINRSDLIAQLNLYHKEFNNLDAITFSRWVNNKTTPSPYKQILIANYFNDDLLLFIKRDITIKKESKLTINIFDKTMSNIENSYHNISYFYSTEKANYMIDMPDNEKYNELFNTYYMNFSIYQELQKLYNSNNIKKKYLTITKEKKGIVSSHLSVIEPDNLLLNTLSNYFKINTIECELFVNLGYIEDRKSYISMTSLLYYLFYKNSIRNITCLVRGDFLDFLTALPYKQIGTTYIDNGRKLYLIHADFLNVLSTPFIREYLLKFLSDHNENINQFFSGHLYSTGQMDLENLGKLRRFTT